MTLSYFSKLASEDNVIAVISTSNATQASGNLKVPTIFIGGDRLTAEERERFYWGIKFQRILYDEISYSIPRLKREASIENAVLVTDNTLSTNGYNSLIKEVLPLHNISLLGSYTMEENLQDLALRIKELKPDMVIFSTNTENAINFLKEAKNNNLQSKIFLGGYNINVNMLADNYAGLPEGVYAQKSLTSINRDLVKSGNATASFTLFDKKIAGRTSNGITNSVHLNTYDTVNMLDFIIKEKVPATNDLAKQREELAKAIWATTNYKSTRGIIFADGKTGNLRRNYIRIAVLTDGKVNILAPN